MRKVFKSGSYSKTMFSIHEVYYEDGVAFSCTQESVGSCGDNLEELKEDIESFKQALDKPVLDYETLEVIENFLKKPT